MVNKQDLKKYKAELQITIANKISEAINKLSGAIIVKLENNKDEIIQSLRNEVSSLQNRARKLKSQVFLLKDALINHKIKTNNVGQYSRLNNTVIQGIPQSIKIKELEDDKAELQITVGNKTREATNKLNGVIIVKLENNKDEIIQCLRNEVSSLENLKSSKAQYVKKSSLLIKGCPDKSEN